MPTILRASRKKSGTLLVVGMDSNGEPAALLSRRPQSDSYPGSYRPTAGGKLNVREKRKPRIAGFRSAAIRETGEELGAGFGKFVKKNSDLIIKLDEFCITGRESVAFGLIVDLPVSAMHRAMRPNQEISGFRLMREWQTARIQKLKRRQTNFRPPGRGLWMLPEHLRAVKKVLALAALLIAENGLLPKPGGKP